MNNNMKSRIIVGANYGDEGKGRVTSEYVKTAEGKVLNVLTNGGSQRGHTVLKDGELRVCQHFGSGTVFGADNYFSSYFILNPMQFAKEAVTLLKMPKLYANTECRVTTPYDMIVNMARNKDKFASCGFGIWETVKRYGLGPHMTLGDIVAASCSERQLYMQRIREYYRREAESLDDEMKEIWVSRGLEEAYTRDLNFMLSMLTLTDDSIITRYDEAIFENGQGLLLCDRGLDEADRTPSDTSSWCAERIIMNACPQSEVSIHYVTRPYLTRHGAGPMENEDRGKITEHLTDDTNQYNEHQGSLRYGALDLESLKNRIDSDMKYTLLNVTRKTVDVTHCDEMDRMKEFGRMFDNVNFWSY